MRFIRFILNIGLALAAVAATFAILVYLNPSWQKALLEEAFKRDTQRQWQVGAVELKATGMRAEGLFVLDGPFGLEVRRLDASGPFWRVPLTGVWRVEQGVIEGLSLDVSQVAIGDLTSQDWQAFLHGLPGNMRFWEERVGLVLHKLAASGWNLSLSGVEVRGQVLLPGGNIAPVSWRIVEADTRDPGNVRIEPLEEGSPEELLL
jgi:hypothetical protein